jgi:hypothetical protein
MILTIDIGLRNLAMCIMSAVEKHEISTYNIHLWDVYNTLDSDDYQCESIQKNGQICGKKCTCKYLVGEQYKYCCKTHFPKENVMTKNNNFKKKAINDYLLQDIAKIVLNRIQEIFDDNKCIFMQVKNVLIELQPKINQKMKFTSHIIYGKLVELYKDMPVTIRFVRASQKLKAYNGPNIECILKGKYAQRKWLSIQYTKWFLENKFSKEQKDKWLPMFLSHKKADDLSDVNLMAINGHYGIPKKQITNKKGKCIK